MRVPVLAYHAVNIAGNEYATNDHVAFAADLRLIDDLGLRIVPLHWVVDQVIGAADRDLTGCVALTCDDGSAFDFHDLDHPTHGPQRSLFNCLQDFIAERGAQAQPDLHLTSFVIASPEARERMDQACLAGLGWMGEDWWREANESGLMAIENHSWDHATRYINDRIAPRRTRIFCYPFSHVPEYLRSEYLPDATAGHGILAAMGDGATPVTQQSDRWNLPRYICGWHWKSPDALRAIFL